MLGSKPPRHTSTRGFTIVELLIIAPIIILTLGAFITAIVNMTGDVLASRSSSALVYDIQDALDRIEQDVKLSSTFLAINNITPLTSPQGYNNDTTNFTNIDSTKGDMLILNSLATNGNPLLATSSLFYLDDQPNDCSSTQLTQNIPMSMNIVYFVKDSSLWRRVIAPDNYNTAGCPVPPALPWQQPSCNPTFMIAQPGASTFCRTQDAKLIESVDPEDFIIEYFNAADATIANAVASSDPDPAVRNTALQSATTINAALTIDKTAAGRTISQSGAVRVTRLDINSSTIAPVIADTVPSAPTNITATFNSPGNITVGWNPSATSYTLQYDTSNSFSAPTTINNITGLSQVVTDLNAAPIYYFRVSSTNSAGTSGWSSTASSNSTIVNGLVGWWNFNGNANTSVGSANGIVNGATLTSGQSGQANTAYSFGTCCQYIRTSALPALPSTLSISAWIYPTAYPSERAAIVVDYAGGDGYYFSLNSDGSLQSYWYGTSSPGYHSSGAGTVLLNQWSFVTVTWSGSQVKLYVNGILRTTITTTGGGAISNNIDIGAQAISSSRQFVGKIDDLRIYNRVLSAEEIGGLDDDGAR